MRSSSWALALLLASGTAAAQGATEAGTRGAHFGRCGEPSTVPETRDQQPGIPLPPSPGPCVGVGLEIFGQYALRLTNTDTGSASFHSFDLSRGHAAVHARYGDVTGRFVFEAVRSAGEGALLGVAGDSLVTRVREAYAQWNGLGVGGERVLEFRAGVIPTLTIPEIEGTWRLRAVAPTPLETTGLAAPADLGATLRLRAPRRWGWLGVGVFNGDGYNQRELNPGKNLEIALALHPLVGSAALSPLALVASYVIGSVGVGEVRADRLTAGLLWQGRRIRAGASFTYGWGADGDAARRTWLLEGFVQGEIAGRWIVGARALRWKRDERADNDHLSAVVGTLGVRIAESMEVFAAVERWIPGARAVLALPNSDRWDFRAVARVVF